MSLSWEAAGARILACVHVLSEWPWQAQSQREISEIRKTLERELAEVRDSLRALADASRCSVCLFSKYSLSLPTQFKQMAIVCSLNQNRSSQLHASNAACYLTVTAASILYSVADQPRNQFLPGH